MKLILLLQNSLESKCKHENFYLEKSDVWEINRSSVVNNFHAAVSVIFQIGKRRFWAIFVCQKKIFQLFCNFFVYIYIKITIFLWSITISIGFTWPITILLALSRKCFMTQPSVSWKMLFDKIFMVFVSNKNWEMLAQVLQLP